MTDITYMQKIILNPEKIVELSKVDLVDLHEKLKIEIETLTAMKEQAREILYEKVDGSGEVISDMQLTKAVKLIVSTTVEQAEAFGAVIEEVDSKKIPLDIARAHDAVIKSVDAALIRKMYKKGATIPGIEEQGYLIIKAVAKSSDSEA